MLKPEMEAALNQQFNWEQAASQEYLAMAAYFFGRSLDGFARFMVKQSQEETAHAMKLFNYIFERGGHAEPRAIPAPDATFKSAAAVFEAAYKREQSNTASIHKLYALAAELNDYASQAMLHWFIEEQVEEEQWCEQALASFELAGDDPAALLMLDERYGQLGQAAPEAAAPGEGE